MPRNISICSKHDYRCNCVAVIQDGSQELNDIHGSDLNSAIGSRFVIVIMIILKQMGWRETGER